MLKVLATIAAVILGLTVYVAVQNQRAAEQTIHKTKQAPKSVAPSLGQEKPQENNENPQRNSPSWYGFFTWPDGMTAWAILLTLWAVAWQANETKKAAEGTLASANAARAQIQLIKDKERGRLRIEFGKVDVAGDPGDDGCYQVPFSVFLDGATQVSIVEQSCFVGISEGGNGTTDHQAWRTMAVPGTITPEDRIFKASMLLLTHEVPYVEPFIDPDMVRVALTREDKLHIFARAFIKYEDLFGGIWEARFNKMWRYNSNFFTDNSIDLSHGFWTSVGDNGEYKAEKQPQNPN